MVTSFCISLLFAENKGEISYIIEQTGNSYTKKGARLFLSWYISKKTTKDHNGVTISQFLKNIYKLVKYHQPKMVPKSPLGQAIAYTLNNWCILGKFLADGKLEIDNNRRKENQAHCNWQKKSYFVGSEQDKRGKSCRYFLQPD